MKPHPYIGINATATCYDRNAPNFTSKYTGIIVDVSIDSIECDGYAVHYPAATLLLPDGTHKVFLMERVTVDPAIATVRLTGKSDLCPPLVPATTA